MRWSEGIVWAIVGLLVASALGLMFLIDAFLGSTFLVLAVGTVAWVYGVRKRRVEAALREVAEATGMELEPHWLTYSAVEGVYRGHPTRIEVASSHDFGAGSIATVASHVNVAAADIRNFTRVRMRPASSPSIPVDWPATPADEETVVDLPLVGASREELLQGLADALVAAQEGG